MRRWLLAAAGLVAIVAVVGLSPRRAPTPQLVIDDSVAEDFAAVADGVWERFVAGFPNQRECVGEVRLIADYGLEDLARYEEGSRIVFVRVPASRQLLESGLVHELGHHLEAACPSHAEFRPGFLDALGLSADADWFSAAAWEAIPSEIFAETVVVHVLRGDAARHPLIGVIPDELVERVEEWAGT